MKANALVAVVLVTVTAGLGAQDHLGSAKDLYAAAAYEDALSALNRIEAPALDVARQVDEYRAFCLFALGRTAEAEAVAEAMIRREPLASLSAADASPRLELMFTTVRKRLLPSLIRDRFRLARAALDQKDFAVAESLLLEARLMLGEAATVGVSDDTLADLNLLTDGYLLLIRTTVDQQVQARPAPPPPPPPTSEALPVSAARSLASSGSSSAPPAAPRVYSAEDKDVVPPVTLEQRMPVLSEEMKLLTKVWNIGGTLTIVIDETGRVSDAIVRPPVSSSFNSLITNTARQWRYIPAKKAGVAVRYLKMMALVP